MLLRRSEKNHYEKLITDNKNNLRKSWRIIKEVLNKNKSSPVQDEFLINNKTTKDPHAISNHFNSFFTNTGPNLASKLPRTSTNPAHYLPPAPSNVFHPQPVTATDISTILKNLKEGSSGPDEIPSKILKSISQYISGPLAHAITLSFNDGYFPDELKQAKVVPIFKAGDPQLVSNYRPISVLNSLSKVYERAFYNQLFSFITINNILYNYQFGFRPSHSTNLALTLLTDKITEAIDNKKIMAGVFLDFSKAFETVNHNILLNKLRHYGIQNSALDWITSYLSNRTQLVSYNNAISSNLQIKCGVPQGSILSPLFFLLYINNLTNISDKLFLSCLPKIPTSSTLQKTFMKSLTH